MAFFSFLDPALNALLGPLLGIPSLAAILLISLGMTLLLTLAYKFLTDQDLMRDLKEEINALQKQMKALKEEPEKMMQVQKKAMELNMKYMMNSMKPTLFTFIPIILIFGWLNTHFAYLPIQPGQEFVVEAMIPGGTEATLAVTPQKGVEFTTDKTVKVVDGKASWGLKAPQGTYELKITHGESTVTHAVRVDDRDYRPPTSTYDSGSIKSVTVVMQKRQVINTPWFDLGWLGTYIICSIFFSITLRKLLKIY